MKVDISYAASISTMGSDNFSSIKLQQCHLQLMACGSLERRHPPLFWTNMRKPAIKFAKLEKIRMRHRHI